MLWERRKEEKELAQRERGEPGECSLLLLLNGMSETEDLH